MSKSDTYTKTEVDGKDALKADLSEIESARGGVQKCDTWGGAEGWIRLDTMPNERWIYISTRKELDVEAISEISGGQKSKNRGRCAKKEKL